MTETERYAAWLEGVDETAETELRAIQADGAEIRDRFYQDLEFGTGGLRGILGIGTNRINIYVVRRATRGLASYMKQRGLPLRAAVAYDSRINSRLFAEETAKTLAICGIDAWVYPRLEPTPALSWAVRVLGCGAGVMITASHNPAEYNGYKVYASDGCQITNRAAKDILHEIQSFGYFDPLPPVDTERIHQIPESVLEGFLDMELAQLSEPLKDLRVVYTPLNGTGLECVRRALSRAGIAELKVVLEQEQPDGRFPTCPKPNPEKREAMELGLSLCAQCRPDLLLATDPDCDRVGVAVPDGDDYRLLSGNETGVLLLDYICKTRAERGTMPRYPVAFTTIVSTEMATAVVERYGVELKRTLTGFKYIGEQIGLLGKERETERFIFGFEESHGYLSNTGVRDKDGVNASLLICEMVQYYKNRGQTLPEVLDHLNQQYGYYCDQLRTFDFPGKDGLSGMCAIMDGLRKDPPARIAGAAVEKIEDYLDTQKTGLPSANVMTFRMANETKLTIRPSGTEPKIKAYLSAKGKTRQDSERKLEELNKSLMQFIQVE